MLFIQGEGGTLAKTAPPVEQHNWGPLAGIVLSDESLFVSPHPLMRRFACPGIDPPGITDEPVARQQVPAGNWERLVVPHRSHTVSGGRRTSSRLPGWVLFSFEREKEGSSLRPAN
jgi:hypothetical protein